MDKTTTKFIAALEKIDLENKQNAAFNKVAIEKLLELLVAKGILDATEVTKVKSAAKDAAANVTAYDIPRFFRGM